MNKLVQHIQKICGYLTVALTTADLTHLADPLTTLVGKKAYYAVVVMAGFITAARDHMVNPLSSSPSPSQPPPPPSP